MGVETIKRFTCGRCGGKKEFMAGPDIPKNAETQPIGWSRAVVGQPVLANPMEAEKIGDLMLCENCTGDLMRFLKIERSLDLVAHHG